MRFERWFITGCALAALVGCGGGGGGNGNSGPRVFMITEAERLISIDPSTPGTIESNEALTGLAGGESILGMDFRGNGDLYALGSTGQLYVIDIDLAAAVPVGPGIGVDVTGITNLSFDFNPVVDRIRIITDDDRNFRVNPNDGLAVDTDPVTVGIQLDSSINPAGATAVAAAYTPVEAGVTTLFAIDEDDGELLRIGSVGGTPSSPNAGVQTVIGSLGFTNHFSISMDITPDGTALLTDAVGSVTSLYTVNLTTGAATLVGTVGGTHEVEAMAYRD